MVFLLTSRFCHRRRHHSGRGDGWADSFQGEPECSLSSESGGPGKEVPPERARTNQRKKERSARGGMPEKNAETCFDKMERICPASIDLLNTLPMPPCVAPSYGLIGRYSRSKSTGITARQEPRRLLSPTGSNRSAALAGPRH